MLKLKVDAFDLTTSVEKLEIIAKLKFSITLKIFKTYLELTDWFRKHIFYYAQKANLLQKRKILLFVTALKKEKARKNFSLRTIIRISTDAELDSFSQLQKIFSRSNFFHHFDTARILFIDIDVFKIYDFEAMIYHIINDTYISKTLNINSILFFSKMLSSSESKYFSTELKIAELVWIMKRVKHMIETIKKTIVVFIDHSASLFIAKQTTLSSRNIDKLNLRLVRAFIYLFQFELNIRYKSKKSHIISNALLHLSTNAIPRLKNVNQFDVLIYHSCIKNVSRDRFNGLG